MLILGIESSCDDTSVALLDCTDQGCFVVAEKTSSQAGTHRQYGGVVPELAGRLHAENIVPLVESVLENQKQPDAIAVTAGPGMITGLLVGVEVAKGLSYSRDISLIAVNHIEGHIYSVLIEDETNPLLTSPLKGGETAPPPFKEGAGGRSIQFPALALIVSGGHSEIVLMPDHGQYQLLGKTQDDAAGEAFDKVAKLLELPYPGGPQISKLAETGDPKAINFPRPMLNKDNYDFSFSGLKTAALYEVRDRPVIARPEGSKQSRPISGPTNNGSETHGIATSSSASGGGTPRNDTRLNDFCASFEQAIVDVLVTKTMKAVEKYQPKTIILSGGVSANKKLRSTLEQASKELLPDSTFHLAQPKYCTDNAAMIAVVGYFKALRNEYTDWKDIEADPNWKVYQQH